MHSGEGPWRVLDAATGGEAHLACNGRARRYHAEVVVGNFERPCSKLVIPAKAGIQCLQAFEAQGHWIPAFAGMTFHGRFFEVPCGLRSLVVSRADRHYWTHD